ncbi:hypothetical protein EVS84_05600 [Pseudomonas koreensis]|uniref:Uncharacterized protein n=1 Tax=Pseudomonas koreensis TaxID=198620 RepID=A0A4Q4L8W6_9PSED|nr:hypothetical protein EVS84_05600 [Pseudomonas koreensis]
MGASLLAKADVHSTLMLTDTPYSRAGSLPHFVSGCLRSQRRSATTPISTSTTSNTGARL